MVVELKLLAQAWSLALNGKCSSHIESSQFIYSANQMIGFYMI